jgi:hypothetical protein
MLYTPVPGTPLYAQIREEGRLLDGDLADIHGQWKFNFRHAAISRDDSKTWLDRAFRRDFERNGPSLFRIVRTTLEGWRRYGRHPDPRIRQRFAREAAKLRSGYSALLWAMERHLKQSNSPVAARVRALRTEIRREFGIRARLAGWSLGPLLLTSAKREERRLAAGWTYEPQTFVERTNWAT